MHRKRFLCLLLCACCVLGGAGSAIAAKVNCDAVYCFSGEDFADVTGVCIMELPDSHTGTVMLGNRVLQPGDILTAQQLSQLTFLPLMTEEDVEATLTYLPIYEDRVEQAAAMTITVAGKVDNAPIAEDSAMETYKNLPNEGQLKVTDPEGEKLTYTLTRQPKRGTVTIREDGSFLYTPKKNKVGTDSFTFTATDPAGKVSREATVTVRILKPTDNKQYADTTDSTCRFTAEWLRNTGLFVGEQIDGQLCFQPEKTMNRGEFLTMLVKTLDISVDKEAEFTGFTDDAPQWLRPYLAAAMRTGLFAGWPYGSSFGANEIISGAEAALLVQNALDLTVSTDVPTGKENDGQLPAWAMTAITAMADNGITLTAEPVTREIAAGLLYQVDARKTGEIR